MLDNPEAHQPLSGKSVEKIERRMSKAAHTVARRISTFGGQHKYYIHAWNVLPAFLRTSIRDLTSDFYPPTDSADGSRRHHPFSSSAEQGLVIGSMLAKEALSIVEFGHFARSRGQHLNQLGKSLKITGYDLEDVLRAGGSDGASHLKDHYQPNIVAFETTHTSSAESRRAQIYANAVGYMATSTLTCLTEIAIRKEQDVDRVAHRELRDLASHLESDAVVLTTELLA